MSITRAAISTVSGDEFEEFMERHVEALARLVSEHSVSVDERIAKAQGREADFRCGCEEA